jgi:uncharacterized protein YkwD
MATTIMRVLGACIVVTELVILLGASPPASFTMSPAAAAAGVPAALPPVTPGAHERYLAPESVCPGTDVPTLPNAEQVAGMACLIDYARALDGLSALRRSPLLAASAAGKADDIVRCGDFSHTACGRSVNASFDEAGYIALRFSVELSENLGACDGSRGSARSVMRAWLESAAHRENLLNERWVDGAVALRSLPAQGSKLGRAIWVSHFGRREAVAAEFSSPMPASAAGLPPSIALRPSVRPTRAPSGRMTAFRFLVTSTATGTRRAATGASVFFGAHRARTNAQGRATLVVRIRRPGRYRAVTLSAGQQATVSVQIVRSGA